MCRLLLIALLATLAPCMSAQRMHSFSPRFASRFDASRFDRGGFSRGSFFSPGFYDPFFADYLSAGYPIASQPPIILMQSPPQVAPTRDYFPAPAQPLMIELQGDRYVSVSEPQATTEDQTEAMTRESDVTSSSQNPTERRSNGLVAESSPAVLVFRDGHREETSEYTIADGALYTRANYYTDGSWTRKIELSSLNLPETIQSNQSRGVRFQLPSFPNEVIIRP